MKRGAVNENVLSALRAKDYVKEVFDVVMVGLNKTRFPAFSPDGIPVLRKRCFGEGGGDCSQIHTKDEVLLLATIEVKTRVSALGLDAEIKISRSTLLCVT